MDQRNDKIRQVSHAPLSFSLWDGWKRGTHRRRVDFNGPLRKKRGLISTDEIKFLVYSTPMSFVHSVHDIKTWINFEVQLGERTHAGRVNWPPASIRGSSLVSLQHAEIWYFLHLRSETAFNMHVHIPPRSVEWYSNTWDIHVEDVVSEERCRSRWRSENLWYVDWMARWSSKSWRV